MPDPIMEHARDVTIKLHNRVGRFVQLQLYFASRWILLSEVTFSSGKRKKNFNLFLKYEKLRVKFFMLIFLTLSKPQRISACLMLIKLIIT